MVLFEFMVIPEAVTGDATKEQGFRGVEDKRKERLEVKKHKCQMLH